MSEYRSVKGTRDLLPPETALWAAVEETARRVFGLYGFAEIRTPVVEHTELFVRSVGESTDIVGKEMYTFEDRKGRSLTLRPESTASVARAYVEHGLHTWQQPVKLFYVGPQFRYERPQRGRYRQFHQIGAELLGDDSPHADAELLSMLTRFLGELGFRALEVRLNTVGDEESRAEFREALIAYLEPREDELSEDSRRRLRSNPLRILDSKNPRDREILEGAPGLSGHLTDEARSHFETVRSGLERLGVVHVVDPRLVRGLDYYTHTVFEIVSRDLGAQDALVGGGRYDELIASLGGPPVPGIGFAIGEDRLLDVLPEDFRRTVSPEPAILAVAVGEAGIGAVLELGETVRAAGIPCEVELSARSLGASLKRADKIGTRLVLILGDEELESDTVTVKDLERGTQQRVPRSILIETLETTR